MLRLDNFSLFVKSYHFKPKLNGMVNVQGQTADSTEGDDPVFVADFFPGVEVFAGDAVADLDG